MKETTAKPEVIIAEPRALKHPQHDCTVHDRCQQLRGAPGSLLQKFKNVYVSSIQSRMMKILQSEAFW